MEVHFELGTQFLVVLEISTVYMQFVILQTSSRINTETSRKSGKSWV